MLRVNTGRAIFPLPTTVLITVLITLLSTPSHCSYYPQYGKWTVHTRTWHNTPYTDQVIASHRERTSLVIISNIHCMYTVRWLLYIRIPLGSGSCKLLVLEDPERRTKARRRTHKINTELYLCLHVYFIFLFLLPYRICKLLNCLILILSTSLVFIFSYIVL